MNKNYILYDGAFREALLPFTFTRPVAEIRVGVLTIREKWEKFLGYTTTTLTEDYLADKYPLIEMEHNVFINAGYVPNEDFYSKVKHLKENQVIVFQDEIVAFFMKEEQEEIDFDEVESIEVEGLLPLDCKWNLYVNNEEAIKRDFELLTKDAISQPIPKGVTAVNSSEIFIEEGAELNVCVLNAANGPIYIGKNAVVLDGALIRGSFALGAGSVVKMGAKIYGATTVGPNCKVGGEIKNSILFGNSNKGHEGYLGDSVIGEWCNFGADSNVSNLKNTYSTIRLWSYEKQEYENTNQLCCGLMMGDHSKTSINTMFNTGTVVGVSANIFGIGVPEKLIPSFSWSSQNVVDVYRLKKALKTAGRMMLLSGEKLSDQDKKILEKVFEITENYRVKY